MMSKIVFKNKNLIVIYKPPGISSQPDNTTGEDALTLTKRMLEEDGKHCSLYPVHRLDKVVGGLLAIAASKDSARKLSALVSDGEMSKEYLAVVEGAPEGGIMSDYLLKNSTIGKAVVADKGGAGAKLAELEYLLIASVETEKGTKSLVKITLKTGRFHQIRAQFSSRGYPLLGDKKYGSSDHRAKLPALFAYKLQIPEDSGMITQKYLPALDEYPWNLFKKELYDEV